MQIPDRIASQIANTLRNIADAKTHPGDGLHFAEYLENKLPQPQKETETNVRPD